MTLGNDKRKSTRISDLRKPISIKLCGEKKLKGVITPVGYMKDIITPFQKA